MHNSSTRSVRPCLELSEHGRRWLNEHNTVSRVCLCACRVAQSVTMSAHSVLLDPSNEEYLLVNAKPGWKLLKQWATWPPAFVGEAMALPH